MIDRCVVVVPVRDEDATLQAALDAIMLATASASATHSGIGMSTVVVLDVCTDRSASIAAAYPVDVVVSAAGRVGSARRRGHEVALLGRDPADTMLLSTDADSVVPVSWMLDHLALALDGADLVVGDVVPRRSELDDLAWTRWERAHRALPRRDRIFGANLGVRGSAYLAAGGFDPVPTGEDRALVGRLRARGAVELTSNAAPVVTSARRRGRAPDGFAAYLELAGRDPRATLCAARCP